MSEAAVDYTSSTWLSLLGLLEPHEAFVTVDHSSVWRRHLAWAKQNGGELRDHMTQRFGANMVFLSLLLSTELAMLFNSSDITTKTRAVMITSQYGQIQFWIGLMICVSIFLTLFAMMATFTAWAMVSAISHNNAHAVLRSSIGQYITQLPSRLIVAAIYSFVVWVLGYVSCLLPTAIFCAFLVGTLIVFFHIVAAFSAFGRLLIHTGALGNKRIFDEEFEHALLPAGLHNSLLIKALDRVKKRKTATDQYQNSPELRKKVEIQALYNSGSSSLENEGKGGIAGSQPSASSNDSDCIKPAEHTETSPLLPRASLLNKQDMSVESMQRVVDVDTKQAQDQIIRMSVLSGLTEASQGLPQQQQKTGGEARNRAMVINSFSGPSLQRVESELEKESDCRSQYDAPMPASPPNRPRMSDESTRFPRPSVLNAANPVLKSLTRLRKGMAASGSILPGIMEAERSNEGLNEGERKDVEEARIAVGAGYDDKVETSPINEAVGDTYDDSRGSNLAVNSAVDGLDDLVSEVSYVSLKSKEAESSAPTKADQSYSPQKPHAQSGAEREGPIPMPASAAVKEAVEMGRFTGLGLDAMQTAVVGFVKTSLDEVTREKDME